MNREIKERIEQIKKGEAPEKYTRKYKYFFPIDWTLVSLGRITKRQSEKNKGRTDLKSYSINNQIGFVYQEEQFCDGSYQNIDKTNYKIVKPGEFAYNPARINIGSIGLQKENFDVIISSLYVCFSLDKEQSNTYFENWFKSYDFSKEITRNLEGSVREYLFYENFSNIKLPVPPLEEQQKIAEILMQCDKVIKLYEKEIDELKKLKKACLRKMFPQKGKNVPELRFAGFTEPWEQRKLGEMADVIGGGTPSTSNSEYWDGDIDWYVPAEIIDQVFVDSSKRKITKQGYENSSAKMLPAGTVLFTSRAGIGKTAILRKEACTNQGFQSIVPHKNELDSYFIFSRTEELKRYGETKGAGSTFVEVSGKQMASMDILMPKTIDEQQQIGSYFRNLDNLINLHQRKLEEQKKQKKSLMQLLLTGIVRVKT